MKNIWKVLAAMMVVALPFMVAACSSDDDDDKGPKEQTFTWTYDPNIYVEATKAIDVVFAAQIKNLGYTPDADAKTFTIVTEKSASDMKTEVQAAVALTKVNAAEYCKKLRSGAKITIKRNNSSFLSEKLN